MNRADADGIGLIGAAVGADYDIVAALEDVISGGSTNDDVVVAGLVIAQRAFSNRDVDLPLCYR